MAKESCWNCSAKMAEPVPFCPVCGQPTPHATDSDRLDFDLRQWRAHQERSVANGGSARPATRVADRAAVATAQRATPTVTPAVTPAPVRKRRRIAMPVLHLPVLHLPRLHLPKLRTRHAAQEEIVINVDDPFAYRACATCGAKDWILRGSRNADGTFNYWCVRCSRAFKTTVRLPHGLKPFVSAGVVLVFLLGMMFLLR